MNEVQHRAKIRRNMKKGKKKVPSLVQEGVLDEKGKKPSGGNANVKTEINVE